MDSITERLNKEGFSISNINDFFSKDSISFKDLDFFLIYLSVKESELFIENKKIIIPKNHIIFIGPHKQIKFTENCLNNKLIIFSSTFYEKSLKDSFVLNSELFFGKESDLVIIPMFVDESILNYFIFKRLDKYKNKDQGAYHILVHNVIETFLLEGLFSLERNNSFETVNTHSSYLEIVNKFRVLLQRYYKTQKTVAFYSDLLCVSPQRLSVMTKTILGKGAKKLIAEKVTNEVQKMLENSTLNISEIATELGFADEANFSTFVKKQIGKTPSEFRILIDKNTSVK